MVTRKTAAKRKKENRTNSPCRWDARRAERRAARWVLRRNVSWAAASGRSWNAKHNIYLDPGDSININTRNVTKRNKYDRTTKSSQTFLTLLTATRLASSWATQTALLLEMA